MKDITLDINPWNPSIMKQLKQQGIEFDVFDVRGFQQDADAINRLYIRDLISAKDTDKLRRKLENKIIKKYR